MSRLGTAKERHLAQSLPGRGTAARRPGISTVLFRPLTLISLILIGFFAFGALIVLSGFANDFRKAPPGQATPRSVSAVGYKAFSNYLEYLDYDVVETRGSRDEYDRENRLVIYTPSRPTRRLGQLLKSEGDAINLVILPKWSVGQMIAKGDEEKRKGWARKSSKKGLIYTGFYENLMEDIPAIRRHDEPSPDAQIFFNSPELQRPDLQNEEARYQPNFKDLQYFDLNIGWSGYQNELREDARLEKEELRRKKAEAKGETYEPKKKKEEKKSEADETKKDKEETPEPLPEHKIILKIDGRAVLIHLEDTQTYVLSEPDLINTMAFTTQGGAQLATRILDTVLYDSTAEITSVDFDVNLHGIEANRNIIKLMVTPPFLAATLCLLAAGGLVGWQGFNRFGDPARMRPDYAHGPVSLARTAAEFMGIANRAHKTGEDYAALIRRQVAADLGYKSRMAGDIDTLLDAREKRLKIQPVFENLKHSITNADIQTYGHYAQALAAWRSAMTQSDFPQADLPQTDLLQSDITQAELPQDPQNS